MSMIEFPVVNKFGPDLSTMEALRWFLFDGLDKFFANGRNGRIIPFPPILKDFPYRIFPYRIPMGLVRYIYLDWSLTFSGKCR